MGEMQFPQPGEIHEQYGSDRPFTPIINTLVDVDLTDSRTAFGFTQEPLSAHGPNASIREALPGLRELAQTARDRHTDGVVQEMFDGKTGLINTTGQTDAVSTGKAGIGWDYEDTPKGEWGLI